MGRRIIPPDPHRKRAPQSLLPGRIRIGHCPILSLRAFNEFMTRAYNEFKMLGVPISNSEGVLGIDFLCRPGRFSYISFRRRNGLESTFRFRYKKIV